VQKRSDLNKIRLVRGCKREASQAARDHGDDQDGKVSIKINL
jgi:hypothetical protein